MSYIMNQTISSSREGTTSTIMMQLEAVVFSPPSIPLSFFLSFLLSLSLLALVVCFFLIPLGRSLHVIVAIKDTLVIPSTFWLWFHALYCFHSGRTCPVHEHSLLYLLPWSMVYRFGRWTSKTVPLFFFLPIAPDGGAEGKK